MALLLGPLFCPGLPQLHSFASRVFHPAINAFLYSWLLLSPGLYVLRLICGATRVLQMVVKSYLPFRHGHRHHNGRVRYFSSWLGNNTHNINDVAIQRVAGLDDNINIPSKASDPNVPFQHALSV